MSNTTEYKNALELMKELADKPFYELIEDDNPWLDFEFTKDDNANLIDVMILLTTGGPRISLSYKKGIHYIFGRIEIEMEYKDREKLLEYFAESMA